jgi:hypothetical protein
MRELVTRALKSLPWYLLGSYLIFPAVAAPFTGFASLIWYVGPFDWIANFNKNGFGASLVFLGITIIPGLILWAIRQFFRFAWRAHSMRPSY